MEVIHSIKLPYIRGDLTAHSNNNRANGENWNAQLGGGISSCWGRYTRVLVCLPYHLCEPSEEIKMHIADLRVDELPKYVFYAFSTTSQKIRDTLFLITTHQCGSRLNYRGPMKATRNLDTDNLRISKIWIPFIKSWKYKKYCCLSIPGKWHTF